MQNTMQDTLTAITTAGLKIVVALILLVAGFKLINVLSERIAKLGGLKKLDKTLADTSIYVIKITLKILLVIALIGYLGLDTSGSAALLASLGVGFGLAVNGALSNIAGGAMILITRPFKVDDFIETAGHTGTVESIRLTSTTLVTLDNKVVHIPNSAASSGTIVNYSEKALRRVDLDFSIDYGTDIETAKQVLDKVIRSNSRAITDPAPIVRITAHGDNSLTLCCRVWTATEDYWDLYFDLMEQAKTAFDEAGISIPFPQLDVHVRQ